MAGKKCFMGSHIQISLQECHVVCRIALTCLLKLKGHNSQSMSFIKMEYCCCWLLWISPQVPKGWKKTQWRVLEIRKKRNTQCLSIAKIKEIKHKSIFISVLLVGQFQVSENVKLITWEERREKNKYVIAHTKENRTVTMRAFLWTTIYI